MEKESDGFVKLVLIAVLIVSGFVMAFQLWPQYEGMPVYPPTPASDVIE